MDSAKQEPEEISEITASNLLELYGSDVIYQKQEGSTENDSVKRNRYVCRKCGKELIDRKSLEGHEKRWSRLTCKICDEEFQCRFGLIQHIRRDHENEFECRKCPFVGKDLNFLRAHCNNRHKVQPVTLEPSLEMPATHNKYACSKCGLEFGIRKDFREHQSQMGNFECLLCEKDFECEYARSQHLEKYHEKEVNQLATLQHKEQSELETFDVEMKFKCDHCGLSFYKKRNLLIHMNDHFKFPLSCDDCGTRFSVMEHLKSHRKNDSVNFRCKKQSCLKMCKEVFKCKRALNMHIEKHHKEIWKCPECPEIFNTKYKLQVHSNEQHNNKFQCDLCELSFLKERALTFHKWSFHQMNRNQKFSKKFSCSKCRKKFKILNNLIKHEILKHPKKKTKKNQTSDLHRNQNPQMDSNGSIVPKQEKSSTENDPVNPCVKRFACRLACRKCGQKFANQTRLNGHERLWSKLFCEICDEEFQCRFSLAQHMRQDHENEFECRKCPFVGKNLNFLRVHCNNRHKAQTIALQAALEMSDTHNKYACCKCGLEFGTRKGFREHQSQMGNFKCLFCDEEFECEHARSQHLERDHEQEFNQLATLQHKKQSELDVEIQFECDHCGLTFDTKRKLVLHMLDHLKFAFSCDDCGARFSWLRSLKNHRKKHFLHFKCSRKNCIKVFKCKQDLRIHVRDEHERNWKCPECPKILKTRKSLKSHLKYNHKNLRDIAEPLWISKNPKMENQCNQCQLSFANKALLKFHMSKHKLHDAAMEALVFSCKRCGSEFESHKELSLHKTIADEYNCAFWDEKYDFKQEKSSYIDQRLETVEKNEQEDSPSMTDTLGMNIHVKEEPEVSYVLKLPSE